MRLLRFSVLYMALALSANVASADIQTAVALREGDMKKLVFHPEALPTAKAAFLHEDGGEGTLADYEGKYVLLNFWATWCAPCRHEMPMLSELQEELGGDDFEVVTLATGRNMPPAMAKFLKEIGVDNLPQHRDPKQTVAREMKVFGLPTTMILDPEGNEIARLRGDADWSSDNAKAILTTLIGHTSN
ncbi:TlpA family protein disulfide reductase [Cognatishimia activa]|uniref:Cytochrome c biogenesis protein TlpA n=1 Tax=Cognatishimia activa TaxID=1715691 RepID=A0A0P1IVN3_9RHOB|nr:TlpA disulfide reductase family protein [Cognatishimia activa]CUJ03611.1 Cytochrome c biogenesis protein TlpA [Cognatishimia activa]CUK26101.1 Cytochrome c biogenesis protein TlpA [Cognatishimia activa]